MENSRQLSHVLAQHIVSSVESLPSSLDFDRQQKVGRLLDDHGLAFEVHYVFVQKRPSCVL